MKIWKTRKPKTENKTTITHSLLLCQGLYVYLTNFQIETPLSCSLTFLWTLTLNFNSDMYLSLPGTVLVEFFLFLCHCSPAMNIKHKTACHQFCFSFLLSQYFLLVHGWSFFCFLSFPSWCNYFLPPLHFHLFLSYVYVCCRFVFCYSLSFILLISVDTPHSFVLHLWVFNTFSYWYGNSIDVSLVKCPVNVQITQSIMKQELIYLHQNLDLLLLVRLFLVVSSKSAWRNKTKSQLWCGVKWFIVRCVWLVGL